MEGSRQFMLQSAFLSLYEYYGQRLNGLTIDETMALTKDVYGIMSVEQMPGRRAVQTLDSRINNNLEGYVKTLMAGAKK